MSRGVYVALSGAVAQEHTVETTAQNLANASTAGYQKMRPLFREVMAGASRREKLHYTVVSGEALDQARGAIRPTGRPLDVALPERHYLAVTTPSGERYTRAGALTLAADGTLQTASGAALVKDDGKPIKIAREGGEVTLSPDGSVLQNGATVARLKVVRAAEGTTFQHESGGLLNASGAVTPGDSPLEVGVLEDSNGSAISAMTDLVTASRTFEAFQKMLDAFGECDRKVLTTVPTAVEG